jgi:hypothetical protein
VELRSNKCNIPEEFNLYQHCCENLGGGEDLILCVIYEVARKMREEVIMAMRDPTIHNHNFSRNYNCTLWPHFPPFPQLLRPHSWVQNYSFTISKTSQLQYKFHTRTPPPPTLPPLNFLSPHTHIHHFICVAHTEATVSLSHNFPITSTRAPRSV